MARSIDNSEDIIDSRDVIERIEELEGERDAHNEDNPGEDSDGLTDWEREYDDDARELKALQELAEEGSGYSDWEHGAQLIRDSYFETYAQELAEEIGAISGSEGWPFNCIDWEKAARELRMDYSSIDFNGETYWVR